jgi:hypothetical protein
VWPEVAQERIIDPAKVFRPGLQAGD